jgi:hypothetical protein
MDSTGIQIVTTGRILENNELNDTSSLTVKHMLILVLLRYGAIWPLHYLKSTATVHSKICWKNMV